MRKFLTLLSLSAYVLIGESFCLIDSTRVRVTDVRGCACENFRTVVIESFEEALRYRVIAAREAVRLPLAPGDTLSYSTSSTLELGASIPFYVMEPTVRKVISVEMPASLDIPVATAGTDCRCAIETSAGTLTMTFTRDNPAPVRPEPDMAPLRLCGPRLAIGNPEAPHSDKTPVCIAVVSKSILEEDGSLSANLQITLEGFSDEEIGSLAKLVSGSVKKNVISIKAHLPRYAVRGDNELSFKPFALNRILRRFVGLLSIGTSLKERSWPVSVGRPIKLSIDDRYTVPKGYYLAGGSRGCLSQSNAGIALV